MCFFFFFFFFFFLKKGVRKHGSTFILEIIFFLRMKIRFFFHNFRVIQYVFLCAYKFTDCCISSVFFLFHKRSGVSRQCLKAIILDN